MITRGHARIGTAGTATTLALAVALTVGGLAGYALRSLAMPRDVATAEQGPLAASPRVGWSADPTSDDWRINSPGIELDRLESGSGRITE